MENVISLDDLFHRRLFRVPDYQRGYSWERQQVEEFLEDLEEIRPGRYHYTGTVVLCTKAPEGEQWDNDGNAYIPVDIVDGQQRLTTIVLLLDAIRRSLEGLSQSSQALAKGITKNFISAEAINEQPLYKLTLNADTNDFFRSNIIAGTPSIVGAQNTSQRRLAAAQKQIFDYLAVNLDTYREKGETWLYDLYKKVANQLRFTIYEVEDEAEVGVIFEVMNDRGKPLTDLEKVKNFLLHTSTRLEIPNHFAGTVNKKWANILQQMMASSLTRADDEDQLLRAHWLVHYNPTRKQWARTKSIKDRFDIRKYKNCHAKLLHELLDFTDGLGQTCISFCDAYRPTRDGAFASFDHNPDVRDQIINWSEKLRRIGVIAAFLPTLIAVRKRWPNGPEQYLQVLKLCEAFAFRVYRLREFRADTGQAAFARLGYDLTHKQLSHEHVIQIMKSQLEYRCNEERFHEELSVQPSANIDWYRWSGLKYFLYEYEIHRAEQLGGFPILPWEELRKRDLKDTVEHILPQSIDKQRYWTSKFNRRNHAMYLHDIGNLTLTNNNPQLQNKSFPDKKGDAKSKTPCYATSTICIEKDLARWDEWDVESINQRRVELLDWAKDRWAVDWGLSTDTANVLEPVEDELDEDASIFTDASTY